MNTSIFYLDILSKACAMEREICWKMACLLDRLNDDISVLEHIAMHLRSNTSFLFRTVHVYFFVYVYHGVKHAGTLSPIVN